jgi:hypothetical protein
MINELSLIIAHVYELSGVYFNRLIIISLIAYVMARVNITSFMHHDAVDFIFIVSTILFQSHTNEDRHKFREYESLLANL